ncbi:DsbA family oxidoreductase [Pseudorhodoferax soli]|uniref:Putative DsbA family dithiol-disulfide isomerase n=1 Tax=Pseudorhodoferax soli TaxID=545864 RepID=A0A368XK34_9BURK|nr:DsbA family oxidoreductase [Pseudorhodoferax soli]RCW67949.1 putative DsbA family dithiol-disulfide isomerase [Pseudorhodoferax soli]
MKTVNVEVWSDFVCPWCWIAKKRFDKAVASLAGQVQVVVTNRAYRLGRGVLPMDYKSILHQKLGGAAAADQMMAAVSANGLAEGLVYNFDTMRFGDTTQAHALIKHINEPLIAERLMERLYKAATTDGLDIFDRDVLISLANEVGVTDTSFDLECVLIFAKIRRDETEANRVANGVPLFLFNGSVYVSGAREVGVFERAILDAARQAPEEMTGAGEGESCGIDGCSR